MEEKYSALLPYTTITLAVFNALYEDSEFDNIYAAPPAPEKEDIVQTVTKTQKTGSLIQTGQLKWPVPVLTAAGALLILLGVWLKRREEEKADA